MAAKKATKKEADQAVITVRTSKAFHKRLRVAAAHHGVTIQALMLTGAEMALGGK